MVVLISNVDDAHTPIAIVDGFYPKKETLQSAYQLYSQSGLRRFSSDFHTTREAYESLCGRVNALEAESTEGDSNKTLDQYLLYRSDEKGMKQRLATRSKESEAVQKLDDILNDTQHPNYCINIIADPRTNDWDRLKRYVFSWLSATQFAVKNKEEYKNVSEYVELCDKLFDRIEENYTDSIGCALGNDINSATSKWSGVRVNH